MVSEIFIGIGLGFIELFLYLLLIPKGSSVFILIWILIYLIGLISSIFTNRFNDSNTRNRFSGGFGDASRYDIHVDSMVETTFEKHEVTNGKRKLRLNHPTTFVYLCFLVINFFVFLK